MEKGLAIVEVNDTEIKGIHIDQDVLEFARMNNQTKKRLAKADAEKREAIRNRRKAEKREARRMAYTINTVKYILFRVAVMMAAVWACMAGFIHPIICTPVTLFCVSTACLRLGTWIERSKRNECT